MLVGPERDYGGWKACLMFGGGSTKADAAWQAELSVRLSREGTRIEHAVSDADVLRAVETRAAHLALLSDTPRMGGLSVLRMIRGIDRSLPCVLVASGPDRRWLERALALGAKSVFSPPIDLELMCRLVRKLLQARSEAFGGLS